MSESGETHCSLSRGFLLFKQKTAYERRISDWSSDVCSSDLRRTSLRPARLSDMASWEASYEEPVVADYGRYTVAKCGPWSQGPVFLQQLAMLKHTDIVSHASDSAAFVNGIAEIAKLAMADRLAWYGAPAGGNVPRPEERRVGKGGVRTVRTEGE